MNTETEKVLDKIKKLLARANSNNPHEAELAMEKAQSLMMEHDLNLSQVQSHDSEYNEEQVREASRRTPEIRFVVYILEEFFFVRSFDHICYDREQDYARIVRTFLFGKRHHVAISEYVFVYLCRTFCDLWRQYRRTVVVRRGDQIEFYRGVWRGLENKLLEDRKRQIRSGNRSNEIILAERSLANMNS